MSHAEGGRELDMLRDLAAQTVASTLRADGVVAQQVADALDGRAVERIAAVDGPVPDLLRRLMARNAQVANIVITDSSGQIRLNAVNPSLLYDMADRDFVRFFRGGGGGLFLGGPYERPQGGDPVFGVSAPLRAAGGGLGGMVLVATARSYMEGLYRHPRLFETMVAALVGVDGQVLSATSDESASIDVRNLVRAEIAAGHDRGIVHGTIGPSTDDRSWSMGATAPDSNRDGLFSYRVVPGWSASLLVGVDTVELNARGWWQIVVVMVLLLLVALPLAVLAVVMARRAREQAALLVHWQSRAATRPRAANPLNVRKHAALTTLAAGIAHDLNNLLSVVVSATSMIDEATKDPVVRSATSSLDAAAQQGGDLGRQLLAYGRRQMLLPARFDMNVELARIKPVLEAALLEGGMPTGGERRRGGLTLELDRRALPVQLDPAQLAACMVALLDNARHASDDEVRVVIRTRLTGSRDPDDATPGAEPAAVVEIEDFGCGMNEDVLTRACDPFFTTRGGSTGLGLSVVHGYVHQSGGTIALQSRPNEGTLVSMEFPLVAGRRVTDWPVGAVPARAVRLQATNRSRPLAPSASVLVVDDNDLVRGSLVRRLRQAGYTVLEAPDAVRAREAHAARIDALVTDVVLPGDMDGFALARWFRARNPRLPLVFVSGFMSFRQPELLASDELASFVRKPIDSVELLAVLDGLLAARGEPPGAGIASTQATLAGGSSDDIAG